MQQKPKPEIAIVLDKRKALTSGLYRISLRATFQVVKDGVKKWPQDYYPTEHSASESDYASIMGKPRTFDHRDIREKLIQIEGKANSICKTNDFVDQVLFKRLYSGPSLATVEGLFDRVIADMKASGQIGTMRDYQTSKNSILSFRAGLVIIQVNHEWLKHYSKWMRTDRNGVNSKGKEVLIKARSLTTVSIYLRCLRRIFNDAIELKMISSDLYPFGRRRFVIQEVRNPKAALSELQKDKLIGFESDSPNVSRAVAFWTISYFCNGANMSDILRLRVKDVQNGMIVFNRQKITTTAKVLKKVVLYQREEISSIIARYGSKTLNPDDYVFPVLNDGLTPEQEKDRIADFIKSINEGLRVVREKLGFPFKLTTYTARHTFSNISLLKGASKEYIQEALGHESMDTTENYLSGFDVETKRKMSERL